MFATYGSFLYNRTPSIKKQKLVSQVVKHHEKQNGLVQVRTRGIHDDWPDESLPWVQMKGGFGSGNSGGTTDQNKALPPIGSKVYSEYEDNSQYHGVYFNGPASDDKKIPEFTGDNYGHTQGNADIGGGLTRTGTKEGEEYHEQIHKTGTQYKMDKDGNFNVDAAKGLNFTSQDGAKLNGKGKLVLDFDEIEIKCKNIKSTIPIQTGGGSPSAPSKPKVRNRPKFTAPGTKV